MIFDVDDIFRQNEIVIENKPFTLTATALAICEVNSKRSLSGQVSITESILSWTGSKHVVLICTRTGPLVLNGIQNSTTNMSFS